MNSFGEYLRDKGEQQGLPLRKVAAELDIYTSILSKIERGQRTAIKDMLSVFFLKFESSAIGSCDRIY